MEIDESALKHGVAETDIEHALANLIIDRALRPNASPPVMISIGEDRSGRLLELIWLQFEDYDLVIHAMGLRRKFRHLLPKGHR